MLDIQGFQRFLVRQVLDEDGGAAHGFPQFLGDGGEGRLRHLLQVFEGGGVMEAHAQPTSAQPPPHLPAAW
jgi:hypothetical protein